MINKFATVYAGHIDFPDHGQNATPANERRFNNDQLAGVYDKLEAIAKTMDRFGFDTLWLAEHHFQHEGYECLPNILMCAVHLAHVTKQLKIGCGFNITPMWHPLRLAEDYATADLLTKGRTVFGVGRGYHSREVETFGAPIIDQNANRELFEEQVEILFKSFNSESFSHKGKHYTLPPEVPYRGYQLKELTLVPRLVPLYEEHVKMFAPLGFVPGLTPDQIAAVARRGNWDAAGVPKVEHFMGLGSWFAGTPDDLVVHLKGIEEKYPGMEHINFSSPLTTPKDIMLEQFQVVAEEVMPHFRGSSLHAAAAK